MRSRRMHASTLPQRARVMAGAAGCARWENGVDLLDGQAVDRLPPVGDALKLFRDVIFWEIPGVVQRHVKLFGVSVPQGSVEEVGDDVRPEIGRNKTYSKAPLWILIGKRMFLRRS